MNKNKFSSSTNDLYFSSHIRPKSNNVLCLFSGDEPLLTPRLDSRKKAGEFLISFFKDSTVERFVMICMTEEKNILSVEEIESGDTGSIFIDVERIVQKAVNASARKVIIAHNHLSSIMKYSMDDFYATEKLYAYFMKSKIELLEHFVISPFGYHSLLYDLADKDAWSDSPS